VDSNQPKKVNQLEDSADFFPFSLTRFLDLRDFSLHF